MWESAFELVERLKSGELRVEEVVDYCFERIEKLNPEINAFVTLADREKLIEDAKAARDKPLAGLPIAVKDNVETRGMRTTYGSKLFADHVPDEDAVVVERLRKAGATILGKTNLPEFGLIAYTDNPLFGVTRNPYDLSRTVGGSSGGSAAAVAAKMVPAATGNDGGGSIRIPASFCNLFGFKPTFGRVPVYPKHPIFIDLHCEGFLTSCVEDAAMLLDVVKGYDPRDPKSLPRDESYVEAIREQPEGSRIALSIDLGYATVEPEVERIVRKAAERLEVFGRVEEIDVKLPSLEAELVKKVVLETVAYIGDRIEEWKKVAYPPYLGFLSMAETLGWRDYVAVQHAVIEFWRAARRVFEDYDFLVTPTVAVPPFEIGKIGVSEIAGKPATPIGWMPFTYPFNFTSQPAASVPAGFAGELPVGMQIVARQHEDAELLRLCKGYQDVYDWRRQEPKL
ncbi:MAG: amidase [Archaeoglobaceae archaeon]